MPDIRVPKVNTTDTEYILAEWITPEGAPASRWPRWSCSATAPAGRADITEPAAALIIPAAYIVIKVDTEAAKPGN